MTGAHVRESIHVPTQPISVLIVDGERGLALLVARCLGQVPGVRIHVLSEVSWSALRVSRHRESYRAIRSRADADRLDAIRWPVIGTGADVVLPVTERSIQFAIRHQSELAGFASLPPLPSMCAFSTSTDKGLLAEYAVQRGLAIPDTIRVRPEANIDDLVREIDYPVLIKPVRGEGGKGIRRFDQPAGAAQFLRSLSVEQASRRLIQRFIPGRDIDCSVLCQDGRILAHTIQRPIVAPMNSFAPASGIEFVADNSALDLAERWASASRWSGVAHLDMRCADDGTRPYLLEVNARYWTSLLGSLQMGVNFPYLACLAALNVPIVSPSYRHGRYFEVGAALRQRLDRLAGKGGIACSLDETPLRFALADPLAEVLHFIRRVGVSRVHECCQRDAGRRSLDDGR